MDCNLKFIEFFCSEIGKIPSIIMDPVSSLNLMSKKQFDELSYPSLNEYTKKIYEMTGYKPGLHICGTTKGLWESFDKLEISFFSADNAEDLKEVKEAIGDKVMVVGNIPPLEAMRFGTINDIIDSVKNCIKKAGDSPKGYMVDTGCGLPIGVPKENLYAYIYAIRKYGRGAKMGQYPKGLLEK